MNKNNLQMQNYQNNKKSDTIVDYKYICIKKDYFDVSLIKLNYDNIKKKQSY